MGTAFPRVPPRNDHWYYRNVNDQITGTCSCCHCTSQAFLRRWTVHSDNGQTSSMNADHLNWRSVSKSSCLRPPSTGCPLPPTATSWRPPATVFGFPWSTSVHALTLIRPRSLVTQSVSCMSAYMSTTVDTAYIVILCKHRLSNTAKSAAGWNVTHIARQTVSF